MKIILLDIGKIILNVIYFFIKLFPTQKKITFISRQFDEPSEEIRLIETEMKEEHPDWKFKLLCHTLEGKAEASLWTMIKYGLHMFVQMYHIATSRVVLLDTYCIVISILRHKKSLKVVQMWHSMGTMKLFGYTAMDKEEGSDYKLAKAMKMHENYDYYFASSMAYAQHLADGFGCDANKAVVQALPRTDLLISKEYESKKREEIFARYPELKTRKNVVYCPTFRSDERRFQQALDQLIEACQGEYNLIIKLHPLAVTELKGKNVIAAKEFSSFDMLFVADAVISDYSCIVYEAAIRHIPLYFYNFDYDEYLGKRGLALDYPGELPGTISGDAREIAAALQEPYDMEKLKLFSEKYVVVTGHATKDIVEFLVSL